jgi:hypothetical protein
MTLAFVSQTRTAERVQCPVSEVNFWTFYP